MPGAGTYRSDVKEYGLSGEGGDDGEFVMTEEQFETLEDFCAEETRKVSYSQSFAEDNDLVSTKDLVLSLREKLSITSEIHNLLFDQERRARSM